MLSGKRVAFIIPFTKKQVARDMAGGYGFLTGDNLILPPLDFMSVAAVVEKSGAEARIFDFSHKSLFEGDPFDIILSAGRFDVYIFNVSMITQSEDHLFIIETEKRLSKKFDKNQIRIYGYTQVPVASVHERIINETPVNACLVGEVETSITGIIASGSGNGMVYKDHDGNIIRTAPAFVEDLDCLPIPARHLVDHSKYLYDLLGYEGVATIQTSKGCPFGCCYYCPYPAAQGGKWRKKSVDKVLEEIKDIINGGINKILFRDAVFTLDRERTKAICRGIINAGRDISWWCEARANNLDEDLLLLMKKAGCRGINLGIETGDEEVLKKTAKPGVAGNDIKNIMETAKRLGIHIHCLFIIGMPGENRKSLYKTYNLITDLKPSTMNIDMITPYPGTPFYEEALSKGWITEKNIEKYDGQTAVMKTDSLSIDDLIKTRDLMAGTYIVMKKPFSLINSLRLFYRRLKFLRFVHAGF